MPAATHCVKRSLTGYLNINLYSTGHTGLCFEIGTVKIKIDGKEGGIPIFSDRCKLYLLDNGGDVTN